MVIIETNSADTSPHVAKDGKVYESYERMREANIRYNEELLKSKGLDAASFADMLSKAKAHSKRQQKPKQQQEQEQQSKLNVDHSMQRRSARKRKTPEFLSLDYDEPLSNAKSRSAGKKARKLAPISTLSEEDRENLRTEVDWLDDMEKYLIEEEKLSIANQKSVMRQVEKLVSGTGVTYGRWADNIIFAKGISVTLSDDFETMYDEAVEFENEHGRDLGNGELCQ